MGQDSCLEGACTPNQQAKPCFSWATLHGDGRCRRESNRSTEGHRHASLARDRVMPRAHMFKLSDSLGILLSEAMLIARGVVIIPSWNSGFDQLECATEVEHERLTRFLQEGNRHNFPKTVHRQHPPK